jgi:hypothetical protein
MIGRITVGLLQPAHCLSTQNDWAHHVQLHGIIVGWHHSCFVEVVTVMVLVTVMVTVLVGIMPCNGKRNGTGDEVSPGYVWRVPWRSLSDSLVGTQEIGPWEERGLA